MPREGSTASAFQMPPPVSAVTNAPPGASGRRANTPVPRGSALATAGCRSAGSSQGSHVAMTPAASIRRERTAYRDPERRTGGTATAAMRRLPLGVRDPAATRRSRRRPSQGSPPARNRRATTKAHGTSAYASKSPQCPITSRCATNGFAMAMVAATTPDAVPLSSRSMPNPTMRGIPRSTSFSTIIPGISVSTIATIASWGTARGRPDPSPIDPGSRSCRGVKTRS